MVSLTVIVWLWELEACILLHLPIFSLFACVCFRCSILSSLDHHGRRHYIMLAGSVQASELANAMLIWFQLVPECCSVRKQSAENPCRKYSTPANCHVTLGSKIMKPSLTSWDTWPSERARANTALAGYYLLIMPLMWHKVSSYSSSYKVFQEIICRRFKWKELWN